MSGSDNDHARAAVRAVSDRIKTDKAFARRAQEDPVGALTAAGVPEDAVIDFMREEGMGGDVEGYAKCRRTCQCTPCCLSGSCWVTI